MDGGAAAGHRTTHPAQPDESSLVLPSFRPKSSDPRVEGAGLKVVRRARRDSDPGSEWAGDGLVFEDGEWWIEWETQRYPPTSFEGAVLYGPDEEWCRAAVSRARKSWCPSSRRFLASVATGRVIALPCHAWNCPGCNKRKWFASRELFRRGIEEAWKREERVRFLTLTDPHGRMSVKELSQAWDKLAQLLHRGGPAPKRPKKPAKFDSPEAASRWKKEHARWLKKCAARKSLLGEYSAVVEFGDESGRIHLHVLMTGGYVPQKRLVIWAKRCGFGEITFISEVKEGTAEEMGAYAGKMASYAAKASMHVELMKKRGAIRARPVRCSKGWLEQDGGLRRIEEQLGIRPKARGKDEPPRPGGPWALIEVDSNGQPQWRRTIGDTDSLPRVTAVA
jgi:hypothetical protein